MLFEKLYTGQYLNQARRNEAKSDRARLLWDETPSCPPPPPLAKSWPSKQSNPVNTDTEGDIESVRIKRMSGIALYQELSIIIDYRLYRLH